MGGKNSKVVKSKGSGSGGGGGGWGGCEIVRGEETVCTGKNKKYRDQSESKDFRGRGRGKAV